MEYRGAEERFCDPAGILLLQFANDAPSLPLSFPFLAHLICYVFEGLVGNTF